MTLRARSEDGFCQDKTEEEVNQRSQEVHREGITFERIIKTIKVCKPTGSPIEEQIEQAALAI